MSQKSYLREFFAQVSQNVLLDDLTVSRPKTTVWAKMSQNSLLREFCVQESQIVFLSLFDSFTTYYNCIKENVTRLISAQVLWTSITKLVFSWFDRFTA